MGFVAVSADDLPGRTVDGPIGLAISGVRCTHRREACRAGGSIREALISRCRGALAGMGDGATPSVSDNAGYQAADEQAQTGLSDRWSRSDISLVTVRAYSEELIQIGHACLRTWP